MPDKVLNSVRISDAVSLLPVMLCSYRVSDFGCVAARVIDSRTL